mgnify:CR=1 FL=1
MWQGLQSQGAARDKGEIMWDNHGFVTPSPFPLSRTQPLPLCAALLYNRQHCVSPDSIFPRQFAMCGAGDPGPNGVRSALVKESTNTYKFYASGRRHCQVGGERGHGTCGVGCNGMGQAHDRRESWKAFAARRRSVEPPSSRCMHVHVLSGARAHAADNPAASSY